ncbi:hypothetical protein [Yersinia phage fHe-Yen9-03]|uniref:Uncharacterized protein n=1 Tax=Yersinia phage fHe-Yen9-03 TaxID=2052743 RepID=A0A2C9CYT0_9CAUD|nr:hypothetical protein [Yersinia phage fHe-Yen9-03]
MKHSEILFAILRKSKNTLLDYVSSDYDRNFIIEMKYNYSKLESTLRNLMRLVATDIERFSVLNENNLSNIIYKEDVTSPVLIDTLDNTVFIIKQDTIDIDDIVVFKENERLAFIVLYNCLILAKERQEEIIKIRDEENNRISILSKYL